MNCRLRNQGVSDVCADNFRTFANEKNEKVGWLERQQEPPGQLKRGW